MSNNPPLIVPVAKARRILGDLAENLSDDQVREFVHNLHLLAKEQLVYSSSKVKEYGKKYPRPTNNT